MYWFIKELVERAITSLVELSKGETQEEKLLSTLKTLMLFITCIIMINFWLLGRYLNVVVVDELIVEEQVISDTLSLLEVNESLTNTLDIRTRENRVLLQNSITVTIENNWLRANLNKTLDKLQKSEADNVVLKRICTNTVID